MDSLLKTIQNQVPLSAPEQEIIRALFHEKTYAKGDFLLEAGNICRHVFFINEGLVRYFINDNGEEKTNYFNKEGEFVCNYQSFLPQQPSYTNIQALEDTTVYTISFNDLQQFYKEVKYGERFGRLAIEQVFLSMISQIASIYTDAPSGRYSKFLTIFSAISQRVPQYYIASYVGVKPQSLSRIRKRVAGRH